MPTVQCTIDRHLTHALSSSIIKVSVVADEDERIRLSTHPATRNRHAQAAAKASLTPLHRASLSGLEKEGAKCRTRYIVLGGGGGD
jgi:hypothetical protein